MFNKEIVIGNMAKENGQRKEVINAPVTAATPESNIAVVKN